MSDNAITLSPWGAPQIHEDPGSREASLRRDLTKLQDDHFLQEKHEDRFFKLVYTLK